MAESGLNEGDIRNRKINFHCSMTLNTENLYLYNPVITQHNIRHRDQHSRQLGSRQLLEHPCLQEDNKARSSLNQPNFSVGVQYRQDLPF